MIEIRPDQIQLFLDKVRSTFVSRVAAFLKTHHRDWVQEAGTEGLDALIRRQIVAAEGYGITTETSVVQFIQAGLAYGEDFHSSGQYPEAERILLQDVEGALKAQELVAAAQKGFNPSEA